MRKVVRLRHYSHVRSNDVCTRHSDAFDLTPGAKKTRLALNGYVTESDRLLAVQARALQERKAATEQCRLCRSALRATGRKVVKVGRLVILPDTVMDTLRIPGSMSDTNLQAHMRGLHDRVLPYKDAFEAVGLAPEGPHRSDRRHHGTGGGAGRVRGHHPGCGGRSRGAAREPAPGVADHPRARVDSAQDDPGGSRGGEEAGSRPARRPAEGSAS
jgi:hypothetical protein